MSTDPRKENKSFNFKLDDLRNAQALADSIRKPREPVSQYLRGRFEKKTIRLLDQTVEMGSNSRKLESALLQELNRLIKEPGFAGDLRRLGKISGAQHQAETPLRGIQLVRFNRSILEGAYPSCFKIRRDNLDRVHVDKTLFTPGIVLGPRASYSLSNDPKHLVFLLARYKFCAKLLHGKKSVLEVGCGDAFGSPIVAQGVGDLLCVDAEPVLIDGNRDRLSWLKNVKFEVMNMMSTAPEECFDAAFSIDVLEHINPRVEGAFLSRICNCLKEDGLLILGTPNMTSEQYASDPGASPHINLKNAHSLKRLLDQFFANTFIFSMNDEIVHTGFFPMAHYLFGVGVGRRKSATTSK